MKNVEAAQRSIREKERKRQEQLDKEIKQQKNEAAYEAWCEKARNRPRTAPNSYGYCAGRLRGSSCLDFTFIQQFEMYAECASRQNIENSFY